MTTIFLPFCLRPGVMVKWSQFQNCCGQTVKIGQFWPLTMDKIEGVMVMVSALPPPPPPDLRHRTGPSSTRLDLDSSTCK